MWGGGRLALCLRRIEEGSVGLSWERTQQYGAIPWLLERGETGMLCTMDSSSLRMLARIAFPGGSYRAIDDIYCPDGYGSDLQPCQ